MNRNSRNPNLYDGNKPYYHRQENNMNTNINPRSMSNSNKTKEQLDFDSEFEKWENSFNEWRIGFRNKTDEATYRNYEKKFLEVRDKLLEKRKQIYNTGSMSNDFESQLLAADAMANSILTRYGKPSNNNKSRSISATPIIQTPLPMSSHLNNQINYPMDRMSDNSSMSNNYSMNNCQMTNDPMELLRNIPVHTLIDGIKNYYRNDGGAYPRNQFNDNRRDDGNRDNHRREMRRENRRDKRNERTGNHNRDDQKKRSQSREEMGNIRQESLRKRVDEMFEAARKAKVPKLLSGAGNRRLKILKTMDKSKLSADEKYFLEYHEYITTKRTKHFEEQDLLKAAADATNTENEDKMEGKADAESKIQGEDKMETEEEIVEKNDEADVETKNENRDQNNVETEELVDKNDKVDADPINEDENNTVANN